MKKVIAMDKYPVFSLEIQKKETSYKNVAQIISYFKDLVDNDPVAVYIDIFDHYTHTKNLKTSEISQDILDAQNLIFCFGQKITDPLILAVRPRSISVVEKKDSFIISFLEAPNEPAHKKMEDWAKNLSIK